MKRKVVKFTKFQKEDGTWNVHQDIYERELTEEEIKEKELQKQKEQEDLDKCIKFTVEYAFTQEQLEESEEKLSENIDQMLNGAKTLLSTLIKCHKDRNK